MNKSIFPVLLLLLSSTISLHPVTSHRQRSPVEKFQIDDDSNSEALNNFLQNVLKAKNVLKSIDKTIISSGISVRNNKRKLLWSKNSEWIRDNVVDKNSAISNRIDERSAVNELDIETILDNLGYSGEKSKVPTTSIDKNDAASEHRRYPISDLTGTGIIEYYDYEGEMGKRDSLNGTAISTADSFDIPKKQVYSKPDNTNNSLPQEQFISNEVAPKAKKYVVDLDDKEQEQRDLEVINESEAGDRVVGRPARCRDDAGGDGGALFHSHYVEIQEFEIIPKIGGNGDEDDSFRSPKAVNKPGRTFYIISPADSGGSNSSMTSGSDYQALKITDDMFKGGIEQGNLAEEANGGGYPNSMEMGNDKHWKLVQDQNSMPKKSEESIRKIPIEIHRKEINTEKLRNKRSQQTGSIMYHESIIEPLNWPWDYSSLENSKISFGRELMEVKEINNPRATYITSSSESTPAKGLSSSVTRHRNTNQNIKVFWRPRALTYLHRRKGNRHNQELLENHSRQTDYGQRVKRYTNGVARVRRFVGKNGAAAAAVDEMLVDGGGEIAEKIVKRVFEEVERNKQLKSTLGPGLKRHKKPEESLDKVPLATNPAELKRTEEIMKKVMELLGHLVSEEIQHKTCTKLPPNLHEFLVWLVNDDDESRTTQLTTAANYGKKTEGGGDSKSERFLFPSGERAAGGEGGGRVNDDINEDLRRKVRLLKKLIKEYYSLTVQEQTKVQAVHDYLERQLHFLLKYIDSRVKPRPPAAQSPHPLKKRSEKLFEYKNFSPNFYYDENELPIFSRSRRQVKKNKSKKKKNYKKPKNHQKKKKKKKKKKMKKSKKSKKHKHVREKRSFHLKKSPKISQILPWEVPRIFDINDIKYLTNTSNWDKTTIQDNELKKLFGNVQLNEYFSTSDNSTNKLQQTTSLSVPLGNHTNIHSHELFNEKIPNTTITVVSLTWEKESITSPTNSDNKNFKNIENKEDKLGRVVNKLESRINVFPVSS